MTCTATRHGTHSAFVNDRCRCPDAVEIAYRYEKHLRYEHRHGQKRLIDITGTRRRLQALCAIGYSQPELARLLGTSQQHVWQFLEGPRSRNVTRRTAAKVANLYERHADKPASGPRAARARLTAQRHGWLPPLWWDDDTIADPSYTPPVHHQERSRDEVDQVIVDRLAAGEAVENITPAERFEAFSVMRRRGVDGNEIVRRLRLAGRTYRQYRDRADAAGINGKQVAA